MGGKKGDAIAGAVLLALSAAYTVEALRLPGVKYAVGPGPSFLPLILGGTLTVLALALLIGALLRPSANGSEPHPVHWSAARRIGAIVFALVAYTLLFEGLGYLVSTALFLAFLLALVEPQRWWIVVSVPVASSLLSYVLFVRWLKIPFPRGLLGL
ncbi:MAG: tripartite tricarboxylate transporter TctB family protein [Candidatus Rokubacteria bacterium]|nr:tripartite tricarboxylate transporter TctB family protein [Candidatus Rokubacteria bacterium]